MNPPFSLTDRFGDRLASLSPPESVGGGFSGATVLKVSAAAGAFAVRGWPAGADPRRLRGLHRLLRHVGGRGVPVAVPLLDSTGASLIEHHSRWWQAEPWLPGRADFRASPTDEKLAAAMTTLAAFHVAAATFEPRPEEAELFGGPRHGVAPVVRDRQALLLRRVLGGERTLLTSAVASSPRDEFGDLARRALAEFERTGRRVFRELQLVEAAVPLAPVLRDVWHDHVLFTGDAVTGLIDASACRRDTVAAELSRLLGSFLGDDPPRWDAALAAYACVRPLTADEAALIPILDRSGLLLSAATWLRRRYLFGERVATPAVLARLRETVKRLERM